MPTPPRFIHVGTGGFGRYWCHEVLAPLVHAGKAAPAAAVDINGENLANAREAYGIPPERCYTDPEKAFEEVEADFAVIVVPSDHHEAIVDLAVARGLHILCEKPLADTMTAACRIYHKVERAGLKMAVTTSHRFDQDKQTLLAALRSGRYGPAHYIVGRNTWNCRKRGAWGRGSRYYQKPDPLLTEATVHHFDIMRALAGSNARYVLCRSWNAPWSEFEGDSSALVFVEMLNGVKVFYEGSMTNAAGLNTWGNDHWRVECQKATLELDGRRLRAISDLGGERQAQDIPLLERPAWMNPWLAEMFLEWLAGGPKPPNSLDDHIQCAALLFAAVESAHSQILVDVQRFLAINLAANKPPVDQ